MSEKSANKFLQSDQSMLSCLMLAQKPRQPASSAEERRYESTRDRCISLK